ncbi:MAG: hypothetical protein HXX10_22145 [Rhodoplanes sp.]|uniref:hypothetical protein n=1 Tax=Rhodoplanes sp. TaxID=1968906 RepID=UPI001827AFD2|nr:hypothetical protein [Rhodoplanes sp.]NVO16734.1 hypothetical protein [Rhodoplanes sp.]
MTRSITEPCGFTIHREPRIRRRRTAVLAQLVATVALVLSIAILIAAVTLQIAEAAPLGPPAASGGGLPIAGAVSLGLVVLGGLTVLITGIGAQVRPRD